METDHIVMTPKRKTSCSTTLAIERRAIPNEVETDKTKVYVAGGDHRGIVINKEVAQGMNHNMKKHLYCTGLYYPEWDCHQAFPASSLSKL
jgi:hypothetical protein